MSEGFFGANGGEGSVSEGFFVQMVGTNLASVSEFERKNYDGWIQDGQIQDGRIQDGCHHQVEWEWISLSQIKLVWVKSQSGVRVFLSESERRKQGVWIQHGRIQDGCHHQVESEWMSEVLFVQMVGREVGVKSFLYKWWEPILASVSEFERKN